MRRNLSEEDIESYYSIAGRRFIAFLNHTDTDVRLFDLIAESTKNIRASLPEEESMRIPGKFQELYKRGILNDEQWQELRSLYHGSENDN